MLHIYYSLLFIGVLGLAAIIAGRVSVSTGAPVLLIFLAIGMVAGEDGLGIEYNDAASSFFICSIALAIILFDGGLRTKVSTMHIAGLPAFTLATLGSAITSSIIAVMILLLNKIFPMEHATPIEAMMVGATVCGTDAAAVFFLLRQQKIIISPRMSATLEVESGLNDPMGVFLTMTAIHVIALGEMWTSNDIVLDFFLQMTGGAIIGLIGGKILEWLVSKLDLETGLYSALVVTYIIGLFALSQIIDASGFLAVYLAGIVLGNRRHKAVKTVSHFHDGLSWIAQIIMFLNLGLLVTPTKLIPHIGEGLIISAVLIFIARPLAVMICLWPFGFRGREKAFISWVGLRGGVPIYLTLSIVLENVTISEHYFSIAFVVVLSSLVMQGWTIGAAARLLNMRIADNGFDHHSSTDDNVDRSLVGYKLADDSPALGLVPQSIDLKFASTIGVIRGNVMIKLENLISFQENDYVIVQLLSDDNYAADYIFIPLQDYHLPSLAIHASQLLIMLQRLYGIRIKITDRLLTISDYIIREKGSNLAIGMKLRYNKNVEFIVKSLASNNSPPIINIVFSKEKDPLGDFYRKITHKISKIIDDLR